MDRAVFSFSSEIYQISSLGIYLTSFIMKNFTACLKLCTASFPSLRKLPLFFHVYDRNTVRNFPTSLSFRDKLKNVVSSSETAQKKKKLTVT